MRRLMLLFVTLFGTFLCIWGYKISRPISRPDEYADGYDASAGEWWNTGSVSKEEDWTFDYTVPLNYIPVPGEKDLFMEVDNDGNIVAYHKRVQQADGSYNWEEVNPDIPDNYEPVEGLENVYKVTDADGNVKYLKYIRNEDDTYAFVEVDENGNMLDHNDDATVIDGKHVHITGNTYSLLNDAGIVIGYEKRVQNDDGTFSWVFTDIPSVSEIGQNISLNSGGSTVQSPSLDTSALDSMAQQMAAANSAAANGVGDTYNITINNNSGGSANSMIQDAQNSQPQNQVIQNADGTHTEIQTIRETKTIDGYTTTYETLVKKTYDSSGNLINSFQEGPYEVSKEQSITTAQESTPDPDAKEATLSAEIARVCGGRNYLDSIANEVIAKLNASRAGKTDLSTLTATDTAMQIAKLRATDMCRYDTSESNLPTYGRLASMLEFYGISSSAPGETLWKTTARTADEIDTRFSVVESARETRMKKNATQVGVAIVESNGYYYICEVIL